MSLTDHFDIAKTLYFIQRYLFTACFSLYLYSIRGPVRLQIYTPMQGFILHTEELMGFFSHLIALSILLFHFHSRHPLKPLPPSFSLLPPLPLSPFFITFPSFLPLPSSPSLCVHSHFLALFSSPSTFFSLSPICLSFSLILLSFSPPLPPFSLFPLYLSSPSAFLTPSSLSLLPFSLSLSFPSISPPLLPFSLFPLTLLPFSLYLSFPTVPLVSLCSTCQREKV
jgi:hypothetical protein